MRLQNSYPSMKILVNISTLLLLASPVQCQWIKALRLVKNVLIPSSYRYGPPDIDTFDYIVVGAGPSGCVIANRLSEDENSTVLLLEVGNEESLMTNVPLLNPFLAHTDYAWDYQVKRSNRSCLGMTDQICPWPGGKGFGGGTLINNMIWTRGSALDYDRWDKLGFTGWSYEDILPYFKKIENMNIKDLAESPYHGKGGPVDIGYAPHQTPLLKGYINAGKALGLEEIDYNDPRTLIGISRIQATMHDGWRVTAAKAYVKPILGRSNLHVSLGSLVTRVLVHPGNKTAYGVEYQRKKNKFEVYARKEVIVTAGRNAMIERGTTFTFTPPGQIQPPETEICAFESSKLLMLSGIGHYRHLKTVGIKPLADLPVGDNLHSHPSMNGLVFLVNSSVTIKMHAILDDIGETISSFMDGGRGILTSQGSEAISYFRTKYANLTTPGPAAADIELLFVSSGLNTDNGEYFRRTMGISDELYDSVYGPYNGRDSFSIWTILNYPQSRGTVRLRNKNSATPPIIDAAFYKEDVDIKTMVEGIKIALRLAKTKPLQIFGATLLNTPYPLCKSLVFGSDEYWECAVRSITTETHHQSGTCSMGKVVDERLRVYGIEKLRVADTSIVPILPGAHTQAVAYMIGEKAADLIKEDSSNAHDELRKQENPSEVNEHVLDIHVDF